MSIKVELADLASALAEFPWGYVVTVTDESRAHLRAVPTQFVDGVLAAKVGPGTIAAVAIRPQMTMVFPPTQVDGMSLIVDGDGAAFDDHIELTPTSAVLHRSAMR